MTTADEARRELAKWEEQLRALERGHSVNVGENYSLKQKQQETDRAYESVEKELRRLEQKIEDLRRERSKLEADKRKVDQEARRQDVQSRRVDDQIRDARWQVGDWKNKLSRAQIEERSQKGNR